MSWKSLVPFRALRNDEQTKRGAVESVDEAKARGVKVTVCPPAMPERHGNPLNAKAHPLSGGRVHG